MTKFYITTPIYYVNDKPHIGHAYTSIAADVIARYYRLKGDKVYFLTGTDEHGQKVAASSAKSNISPQEFTDIYSQKFRDMSSKLNLSNNDFIRTTEERHKQAAQSFWKKLYERGYIYLGSYSGWYAVRDEAFYQESEIVDGKAPTGAEVEWVEEPSYFFALSKFQDDLLSLYENNPEFIWPKSRRNEVINFVKSGLKDLSISRTSFNWGIPVVGDEKHVMYVWLDALTNYISALGYPEDTNGKFKELWPADIHLVGKDILRFHAIYWPAFLMAADLPLPKQIVAHGWWTNEGQKISKSLGNVIDPYELTAFYGLDQTRYYMLREVPFGEDGNYSKLGAVRRINSELVNNFGNLAQRTLSLIHKYCDSKTPQKYENHQILESIKENALQYFENMEGNEFSIAIGKIVQIGNIANAYIDEMAPWKLKDDMKNMHNVLYHLLYAIKVIGYLLLPIMPDLSKKLLAQLAIEEKDLSFKYIFEEIEAGKPLPSHYPVFPKIEISEEI